jgi:hypothetical protein
MEGFPVSAFMVTRKHIGYLVDASMSYQFNHGPGCYWAHNGAVHRLNVGDSQRATEVGQMLWDENRKSIEYRYPDTRQDFSNAPGPCDES